MVDKRVHITTFGFYFGTNEFSAGVPSLIYDCRAIRNPDNKGRFSAIGLTGLDDEVFNRVADHELFQPLVNHILDQVRYRLFMEDRQLVEIGIGCTMGRHRSVAVAFRVGMLLEHVNGLVVTTTHRDMEK